MYDDFIEYFKSYQVFQNDKINYYYQILLIIIKNINFMLWEVFILLLIINFIINN